MPLVTTFEMLKKAQEGGYAIGAFNANNMEIVQAIVAAAEERRSPVILQASQGAIKYAGLGMIVAMVREAAASAVPVALHLDHGTDLDQNIRCLRAGFTSLMYDGSKLPFEENVANTKVIVGMAHACGLAVEAEIGQIGKLDDSDEPGVALDKIREMMADPDEAADFIRQTGADFLAAAVGTIHGCREPIAKLDVERITRIRELTDCPLVLHGASGCTDEEITKGINAGVCKINIDTRIRNAFVTRMREVLADNPNEIDPRKILGPCRDAAKEVVLDRIRAFGCSGQA